MDQKVKDELMHSAVTVLGQLPAPIRQISSRIEELNSKLEQATEAQNNLSIKIFWLNVVLAVATLIGAIATVVIASKTK